MTRMLGSVRNVAEASMLLHAGVDIIDIKEPAEGALGAVPLAVTSDIVRSLQGHCISSATIGDLPMQANTISTAITATQTTGVDIIKVGIFSRDLSAEILPVLASHTARGIDIVLVFFADRLPDKINFRSLAGCGIYGAMLDTADKQAGSLRTIMDHASLKGFVDAARAAGLKTGLAGSLQAIDIPPLLGLQADYLGFRGALCRQQDRISQLDSDAVSRVRGMIPVEGKNATELLSMAN